MVFAPDVDPAVWGPVDRWPGAAGAVSPTCHAPGRPHVGSGCESGWETVGSYFAGIEQLLELALLLGNVLGLMRLGAIARHYLALLSRVQIAHRLGHRFPL